MQRSDSARPASVSSRANSRRTCRAPLQYGLGVQAFIINLLVFQMVALKRAQSLVYSIIDVVIAEATMLQFIILFSSVESLKMT